MGIPENDTIGVVAFSAALVSVLWLNRRRVRRRLIYWITGK
jgi:hypothetical protein